ncbi:MAG: hypothetical protein R2867_20670 [Caldilineaceae bacterium]
MGKHIHHTVTVTISDNFRTMLVDTLAVAKRPDASFHGNLRIYGQPRYRIGQLQSSVDFL